MLRDVRELWLVWHLRSIIAGHRRAERRRGRAGLGVRLACGGAMLWARWSLRRVAYERIIPEDHAFAGERCR